MLKLNQQKKQDIIDFTLTEHYQWLQQQASYSKIHTPLKRRLSEYTIQKQSSYAQIHGPERQKQKSTPDVLQLLKKYQNQKCITSQSITQPLQTIFKKHKTLHQNDPPILIKQEALPLKDILLNRKRSSTGDETLIRLQAIKKKINEKALNQLEILQPDSGQSSNKITFQASQHTDDWRTFAQKTIESPGTAQFMESNRTNGLDDIQIIQPQSRRPSVCEDNFQLPSKTISLNKPYFESNKQEDNSNHFTNRLECRKIMIILDQDKDKILDQISLNPADIKSSPTSSVWDKTLKIDRLNESLKRKVDKVDVPSGLQKSKLVKNSLSQENIPYWKLRDQMKKKK